MTLTVDVKPSDLAGAFRAILPHISNDVTLPILNNVLVELTDDGVRVSATDRYTLARSTVKVDRVDGEGNASILITGAKAKAIMAGAGRWKSYPKIPVAFHDDRLDVGFDGDDDAVTARAADDVSSFPKLNHLFESFDGAAKDGVTGVMLNPDYLARFSTRNLARGRYEKNNGLRLRFTSPSKPVLVTFSDHFRGLIMTMRDPEAS